MLRRTNAARWSMTAVAGGLATALLVACNDNRVPTSPGVAGVARDVTDGRFAQGNLPRIRHVFVIALENESYAAAFGPGSPAPYLAASLDVPSSVKRELAESGLAHVRSLLAGPVEAAR